MSALGVPYLLVHPSSCKAEGQEYPKAQGHDLPHFSSKALLRACPSPDLKRYLSKLSVTRLAGEWY